MRGVFRLGAALGFAALVGCGCHGMGIFVVNPDGSGRSKVAGEAWGNPLWSPDGQRIAFVSHDGDGALCVAEADGSGRAVLWSLAFGDDVPRWSPDGEKIAF